MEFFRATKDWSVRFHAAFPNLSHALIECALNPEESHGISYYPVGTGSTIASEINTVRPEYDLMLQELNPKVIELDTKMGQLVFFLYDDGFRVAYSGTNSLCRGMISFQASIDRIRLNI